MMRMRGLVGVMFILFCSVATAAGQSESNVTAYYDYYNTAEIHWDLTKSKVYCKQWDVFVNKPYEWRSKYGWIAFCGNTGPQGMEACGRCLKLTNRRNGMDITVRILDKCPDGLDRLVLDYEEVFYKIDPDYVDARVGHMYVDYEFVDCEDHHFAHNEKISLPFDHF